MIVANIFDFIDGKVARERNRETEFGAFWDSVMDRFSDITLFIGLIYLYTKLGRADYVIITALAMMFSVMTSYTRARAESMIEKCKVGFMERPERIVLFMIGAFTNRMAAVMWVILVLSIVTVADRIYFTWRVLNKVPERKRSLPGTGAVAGVLLDRRARDLAVRPLGGGHPRLRVAHAAQLAGRPDGPRDGVGRAHPAVRAQDAFRRFSGLAVAAAFLPARSALAVFFFPALTASRLLRSASIRFTTFCGVSTGVATTSSPAMLRVDDLPEPLPVVVLEGGQVQLPLEGPDHLLRQLHLVGLDSPRAACEVRRWRRCSGSRRRGAA